MFKKTGIELLNKVTSTFKKTMDELDEALVLLKQEKVMKEETIANLQTDVQDIQAATTEAIIVRDNIAAILGKKESK